MKYNWKSDICLSSTVQHIANISRSISYISPPMHRHAYQRLSAQNMTWPVSFCFRAYHAAMRATALVQPSRTLHVMTSSARPQEQPLEAEKLVTGAPYVKTVVLAVAHGAQEAETSAMNQHAGHASQGPVIPRTQLPLEADPQAEADALLASSQPLEPPAAACEQQTLDSEQTAESQPHQVTSQEQGNCFNCNKPGHWASDCPNPRQAMSAAERKLSSLVHPQLQVIPLPSQHPGIRRQLLNVDQRTPEWLNARESCLTASNILMVAGISPSPGGGAGARHKLFYERIGIAKVQVTYPMQRGTINEQKAMQAYCRQTGLTVASCGFVTYQPEAPSTAAWLGGSPDGLVLGQAGAEALQRAQAAAAAAALQQGGQTEGPEAVLGPILEGAGILEIKCPMGGAHNADKGYKYMFQIQALMEMMEVEWADLFVWSYSKPYGQGGALETRTVRIQRDRAFWAQLLPLLHEFWWGHIVPARQALQAHYRGHPEDDPEHADGAGQQGAVKEAGEQKLEEAARKQRLKAVVEQYLPRKLLAASTSAELEAWARKMYAESDHSSM